MKEKKIVIAVLLSMVFQVEATRSALQHSTVDTDGDMATDKKTSVKKKESKKHHMSKKHESKKHDKEESPVAKRLRIKEQKQKDAQKKKQTHLDNKRAELNKMIQKHEDKIDILEPKLSDAKQEDEDRKAEGKDGAKSHIVNHGSVKVHQIKKEIEDHRAVIDHKQKALDAIAPSKKADTVEDFHKRKALNEVYEKRQKELRSALDKVTDEIHALRHREKMIKDAVQDDKATYEDHLKGLRNSTMHKDSEETAYHKEAILAVPESKEMKALHAKQMKYRDDLAALRVKMKKNNDMRKEDEKDAGLVDKHKQEARDKKTDALIKNGKKNGEEIRPYTQTARDVKERKEELDLKGVTIQKNPIHPKKKRPFEDTGTHLAGSKDHREVVLEKRAEEKEAAKNEPAEEKKPRKGRMTNEDNA